MNETFLNIPWEDFMIKNLLKKLGGVSFLIILAAGCVGNPSATMSVSSSSSGMALDTAIEQAAERIEKAFDPGTEIALISISSLSTQFSEYVLTYLESILVNNGKLAVLDRANLDKIRGEQGFQLSGEVSDESAKRIGQMLGAGAIVTGTLVNLGDVYRLTLKAINIETARIAASYPADIANSPRVQTLLAGGSGITGTQTAQTTQGGDTGGNKAALEKPVPAAPKYEREYKIGDTGPAGGIVFYDKGTVTNGWRYMEAAPNDIVPAQWGANNTAVGGTKTLAGTGKINTQHIVPVLNQVGEDGAALLCGSMNINGYSDWFLPSKDELNMMYVNLKAKGLGGFGNGWYWSSSEADLTGMGGMYSTPEENAWTQRFSDGNQSQSSSRIGGPANKNNTYSVRPIRQF
jgi:hypothetical protein